MANGSRGLSKLIARLLALLTHSARGLIQIALESGYLIGKRLLTLRNLLLLLGGRGAGLSASSKLVNAAADFFLAFQRFFGALPQLLHILLTAGALRGFEHLARLFHSLKRAKLVGRRLLTARL